MSKQEGMFPGHDGHVLGGILEHAWKNLEKPMSQDTYSILWIKE